MPGGTPQPQPATKPELTREQFEKIKRIESLYQDFKKQIDQLKQEQDDIINDALNQIDHDHIEQVLKQIHK